ncbi:vasoactive intestinal polypeptide receptor-like isoform X2 [Symsagittifera roscoffensis]|uniref:vasoactive intestinal polypeptide receptor-like isoform X2 n=1 Tax=Symsagittifera roscoffensis TaxID=84072 RepID=UPI00307BC28E
MMNSNSSISSSYEGYPGNRSDCPNEVFVPPHTFNSEYFMPQLYLDCLARMCLLTQKNASLFCPVLFDGVGCWPATRVNTTQAIPCPSIPFYDQSKFGTHACVMGEKWDGQGEGEGVPVWASHPDYPGLIWSDYSLCEQAIHTNKYQLIQVIYYVGHLLSFAFTLTAFIIFAVFKKLHCPRNVIHMNFFGSIALFCFNYFLQTVLMDTLLTDTLLCNLTHVVVQYCFQTTYFWMLCEAGFLHRTVVTNVFGHNERVGPFIVLGWGAPVMVVTVYVITNLILGKSKVCWISEYGETFSWGVEVPLMLCIAINLVLLISVLRVLIPKINASAANVPSQDVAIKSAKAIIFLSPLFGVHTIVTLWMPREGSNAHIVLGVVQALLQSFQGSVVAIVFCFGNSEVRTEIKSKFTSMNRRRSTDTTFVGPLSRIGSKRSAVTGPVMSSTNL